MPSTNLEVEWQESSISRMMIIPYYYDPIDDCLHADAVCVPFHYKEEDITYKIIGEALDALEDALRDYFKKEKGISLYDYD